MARDVCDFFTGSKHDLLYGYNIPVDVETFFDEGTKKCWLAHNFLNEAIDGELNNFYNSQMFYLPLVQSLKFLGRDSNFVSLSSLKFKQFIPTISC